MLWKTPRMKRLLSISLFFIQEKKYVSMTHR